MLKKPIFILLIFNMFLSFQNHSCAQIRELTFNEFSNSIFDGDSYCNKNHCVIIAYFEECHLWSKHKHIFEEVSHEFHKDISFYKINMTHEIDLVKYLNTYQSPSFIFIPKMENKKYNYYGEEITKDILLNQIHTYFKLIKSI